MTKFNTFTVFFKYTILFLGTKKAYNYIKLFKLQ